jgi:hypothetical protein
MRRAARTDGNHTDVTKALEQSGMRVTSTAALGKGFPDLVVGFRGLTMLLEVKDEAQDPNKRKLTADETKWHQSWPGHVAIVESPEAAVLEVIRHAKEMGKL